MPAAEIVTVAGDYFRTLGIPLRQGRPFDRRDHGAAPRAVMVSETLARQFWPDQSPLGKQVRMVWDRLVEGEVVGVVGEVLQRSLTGDTRPTLYWAHPQFTYGFMTVVARSTAGVPGLHAAVRREIATLAPALPVPDALEMEQIVIQSLSRERAMIQLLSLFAILSLLLSVVGLYGVIAYWTGQRTKEIGIRMALGARRGDVFRLVVGHGARLAALGLVVGLVSALALARVVDLGLFRVEETDPWTYALVSMLLLACALLAAYLPARRASRVDPRTAIHS